MVHSGGYCLRFGPDHRKIKWEVRLTDKCEFFKIENFGCIRHLLSQRFFTTVSFNGGFYMELTEVCENNSKAIGFKREDFSIISRSGMFLAPFEKKLFPAGIHGVFLYSPSNLLARVFEFYFPQGKHSLFVWLYYLTAVEKIAF